MLTGLDCATCGFTRDFNALLSFSEAPLLNGFSLSVFVFFLIQLLVRIILIVFGLDYNQNKFVVALDLGITIVHFLIVFIPILIASTNQTLSLL